MSYIFSLVAKVICKTSLALYFGYHQSYIK